MKKVKVLLNCIPYSVAEKLVFYRNIVAKLSNNPAFPNPDVALTDVKTALDNFEASIVAAPVVAGLRRHRRCTITKKPSIRCFVIWPTMSTK